MQVEFKWNSDAIRIRSDARCIQKNSNAGWPQVNSDASHAQIASSLAKCNINCANCADLQVCKFTSSSRRLDAVNTVYKSLETTKPFLRKLEQGGKATFAAIYHTGISKATRPPNSRKKALAI